jgi:fructokinase
MPTLIVLGELLVEVMRAEKGVPHTAVGEIYRAPFPSGAPAIFASSAARMGKKYGLKVGYIGVTGNDDFGQVIIDKLAADGVDISQIRKSSNHTGAAFVQYNLDGSRRFIFMAGAAGETGPDDVKAAYFTDVQAIHVMGSALAISPNSRDAVYKMLDLALKANPNCEVSFDPNLRPEMLGIDKILQIIKPVMQVATIILPSGEEAETIANTKGADAACKKLFTDGPRVKMVILKQGKDGATAYIKEKDGTIQKISAPSYAVTEVDATGAGDSFGGAFMAEYLNHVPPRDALQFANAVGALKVTHFGPIPNHSRADVESLMKK